MRAEPSPRKDDTQPLPFRGREIVCTFWGVPQNDAYLDPRTGFGPARGPTKTAEHCFTWRMPMAEAMSCLSHKWVQRLGREGGNQVLIHRFF